MEQLLEQIWQEDKKCFAPDAEISPLCLRSGTPYVGVVCVLMRRWWTTWRHGGEERTLPELAVVNQSCLLGHQTAAPKSWMPRFSPPN